MTRRRATMLGTGAVAAVALLLVPTAADSSSDTRPPPPPAREEHRRPPVTRCDPQPDHGAGPPADKGKKCASA